MGNMQFIYRNLRIKLVFIINDCENHQSNAINVLCFQSQGSDCLVSKYYCIMGNIKMCNLKRTSMDCVRRVVYSSLSPSYISRVSTFEQLRSSQLPHAD